MINTIIILFAGFLMNSPGQLSVIEKEWLKHEKPEYSISYPEEWLLNDSGDNGTLFMLNSRLTDEEDTYSEMISLTVQPQNGLNMTLDKYISSAVADIPFFYKNSSIFLNRKENKGGHESVILYYTGDFNEFGLSTYQYTWLLNEQLYVLSFTGQPESVEKMLPEALKIMDSFMFKTTNRK